MKILRYMQNCNINSNTIPKTEKKMQEVMTNGTRNEESDDHDENVSGIPVRKQRKRRKSRDSEMKKPKTKSRIRHSTDNVDELTRSSRKSRRKSSKNLGLHLEKQSRISLVLNELTDDITEGYIGNGTASHYISDDVVVQPQAALPDQIYVQHKGGFSKAPKDKILQPIVKEDINNEEDWGCCRSPIEMAICVQKGCKLIYIFCQGLLGGLAFTYCILAFTVSRLVEDLSTLVVTHAFFVELMECVISALLVFCMLSVLDRTDVAHLNRSHIVEILKYQKVTLLMLITYMVTIIITLATLKLDDEIFIRGYNNTTHWRDVDNDDESLNYNVSQWSKLHLARCIGAVLGWFLSVLVFNQECMFYSYLVNMINQTPNTSRRHSLY